MHFAPYPLRSDTAPRAVFPAGLQEFDRFQTPTAADEPATLTDAQIDDLQDRAAANADSYADWLMGQCFQKTAVRLPYFIRCANSIRDLADVASVPELAVMSIHHDAAVRAAAGHELRIRYLESMGVA